MCPAAVDVIAVHNRAVDLAEGFIEAEKRLYSSVPSRPLEELRTIKRLRNELLRGSPFRDRPHYEHARLARAKLDPSDDVVHVSVAQSVNPSREIASRILVEFQLEPDDVDLLNDLHEKYIAHRKRFLSTHPMTAALGVIALVGRLVPKDVFEVFGIESAYGWYQLLVTAVALYALLIFGVAFGIAGRRLSVRRRAEQVVDSVLIHLRLAVRS